MKLLIVLGLSVLLLGGCGYRSLIRDTVSAVDQPVKTISGDYKRKKFRVDYYEQENQ